MSNVALLIPAYNPGVELPTLLEELLRRDTDHLIQEIVIINDGSDFDHSAVFDCLRTMERVTLITHDSNKGKGAALKSGFAHILANKTNIVSVVTADADGQHLPKDILKVAREGALTPDKLVLGVRILRKDAPLRSLFGNWVTRIVTEFFTGLKVNDTQTGLRSWPITLTRQALSIEKNAYDFEMEALLRSREFLGESLAVREVSIDTVYEEGNKSSHFRPIWDSMRIYYVFLRYCGAGLATAAIDNIIFIIIFMISSNTLISQIISRSCGALVSFILNYRAVFKSAEKKNTTLFKFIVLVVVMGVVSYGLLKFISLEWGMDIILAKILAELILFVISFLIQRKYVFKPKTKL